MRAHGVEKRGRIPNQSPTPSMKLHLPAGLRKALLVCLAAVVPPAAAVSTTIATASGIVAVYPIVSEQTKTDISGPEAVSYDNQADYSDDVPITTNLETTTGDEAISVLNGNGWITAGAPELQSRDWAYTNGGSLEWNVGAGTWSENNFNNIEQQTDGRNITFSSTGAETNVDITVSGAVSAADIAVGSGAKYTFMGGSSLAATGALSIGSDAVVKVDMNMSVTGETTLDGVFEVAQHTYTFAEQIRGRTSGVLKGFGGDGNLSSCIINLKKGGELSNLDVSWGATLNLGADLILHDWHFSDSSPNRYIKFAKDAEAAGEVNLVLDFAESDKTITWHYETEGYDKGSLTFAEVGLEKRGEGNLTLKETEGDSNETHWEVQNLKVSAGTLKIDDSLFTVAGKLSGSATLELLANAGLVLTGGTGTETGFTGTITMGSDTFISLGSGAKLKAGALALGSNTGTIKLAVDSNFADGFLDITSLTMDDSGTLKIVFTDWNEEWITEHSDGLTLFYGDGFSSWIESLMDKITFWGGASGDVDLSSQVVLERNGKLTWASESVAGGDLYWPGSGADSELSWGASGGNEWATGTGQAASAGWTENSRVHLGATGAVTVTLQDASITAASIGFTAANRGGYTFQSGTTRTDLVVGGNMTNNDPSPAAVRVTFDTGVNVHVEGNFINKGATSTFAFREKLRVDGLLQLWGGSTLELEKGGEVGTLDATWGGNHIRLGGDLKLNCWFFEGVNGGGHAVGFSKTETSDSEEVFIEIGKVVNGSQGQQEQAGTMSGTQLVIDGGGHTMTFGEGVGIKKSSDTLEFRGSETFAVGGSYAAVEGGNMVFNVDATAGMNVEIGAGSSITVNSRKQLSAAGRLKGTGGTLILQTGATVTFGSADATASLTSLQLAEGSSLHVGGGNMLNIDTLTLSGAAAIELSGTDSGKIKLGHEIAGDFTLTITLTGLTDEGSTSLLSNGYQLFDSSMNAELLSGLKALFESHKLTVNLGECTYTVVRLDEHGKLIFVNDTTELTHTGSGTEFTWDNASSTWDSNQTFAEGNSVKFLGTGANTVKLGISGVTEVKNMTVQTSDGGVYTFTSDADDNSLNVRFDLNLETAAVFRVDTNVEGTLSGAGALTVDAKTFTLSNSAHDWTGELTVQNEGTFSLAGTVSAGKLTVGANGGRIDLSEAEAVLTVTGDIAGEGNQLTLAGGGRLDWTGGVGSLGSVMVESGEFAIGGTLTMGGDITLVGDNAKLSGSGRIDKKSDLVDDIHVQFRMDGNTETRENMGAWFGDRLGSIELGEGVSLQKTGTGTLTFKGGGTLTQAIDVHEGALKLDEGGDYVLEEKLTGSGNLIVAVAHATGSTPGGSTVTLRQGADMTGDLALSCYTGRLVLGADSTFGGLVTEGNNFGYMDAGGRQHYIKALDGMSVRLTLNVVDGEPKEVRGVNVHSGVTIVKEGAGTQRFIEVANKQNGRVTLSGGVEVKQGVLEIVGDRSTISGALSGEGTEGTLRLARGNLTISGGGKHGGTLELTAGKITISGAALEVGTFKATTGELDVQSNLTIGTGANEGLSTLKIASGTTVTLKGGTLKADTLDLTDTQGASLSIDMTGQAKLDFGGITLGADGKLAIELTGDDDDTGGYQLFEESTFASVWNALVTDGKTWEDVFDITVNGSDDKELKLNQNGWLNIVTRGMEWNGGGDNTWSNNSGSEWGEEEKTPDGREVRFTEEGAERGGSVLIEGEVTPRNVYVDGGEYTFEQTGDGTGGLNIDAERGGILRIGDGGTEAKLTLKLENTSIPEIELRTRGTLVLAHDEALPDDSKIKFQGGVLEYSNAQLTSPDVSSQVASVEEGSRAAVKVSVDGATYTEGVTWGSTSTAVESNGGLKLALDEEGIEKSGSGDFTLAWQGGTGDTHGENITVNEGSLSLNVGNSTTLSGTISGSGTLRITGGEVTLSGENNTVTGIQVDSGATLKAGHANALGGANTTLTLNGGNLSGDNVNVNAGQVRVMEATTLSGVTLAGTVTGGAAMSVGSRTAGLSGDISGYTGELKTETGGTWKLSGKALEQPVTNAVSGSGTVSFAGESVYGGDVKGSVTLEGGGENGEQLVITSRTTSNGAKLKGQVTLGNQGEQAAWQGSTLVNGEITLANVELVAGGIRDKGSAKLYVNTATSAATVAEAYGARAARRGVEVNVNGMSGDQLDGITINEHGQLTGITGSYTADANHKLELHFAGENVGESATVGEGESALITGESDFSLNAESKDNVELWLSSDAVASIIGRLSEADGENGETTDVYLHLLQGGDLTIGEVTLSDLKGSDAELLEMLDITEVRVEGGSIRLAGSATDVFVVNETSTLTDAAVLGTSKSTVLSTPGVELTLNLDGGTADDPEDNRAIVNNLLGVTGSQLHLQNSNQDDPTGANRLEVTFHNAKVGVKDEDKHPVEEPELGETTVEGQHTTFNGSIDVGEGVDVKKTGFGTLSVGGNYTLEDGTTTITAGALKLRGAENILNDLAFDYADVQQQKDKGEDYRGLLLDGGRTTVRGSITEGDNKMGEIVMSHGAELVLNGESDLEGTSIMGDDSTKLTLAARGEQRASLKLRGGKNVELGEDGKRTVLSGVDVEVQEGASMEVSGIDAAMKGSDLTVQGGELKLTEGATMMGGSATLIGSDSLLDLGSSAQNTLTALNGTGTLKSAAGGNTTITGEAGPSVFSGKLANSDGSDGAGKLTIGRNADVTLDNVDTSAAGGNTANAWDVEVQDGGRLTLDVSKSKAGEQVVLGDVNFGSGNTVNLKVNSSNYNLEGSTIKGNTLSFGENTTVMLEAAAGDIWDGDRDLTLGEWGAVKGGGGDIDVQLRGDGFIFADVKGVVVEGTTVIVQLEETKENKFERAMPNGEKNAMAGATMVWESLKYKSELDSLIDVLTNSESDYARMVHGLISQLDNGQTGSLQNALASVAGSSVATIGPAVMEDLHRQIKTIRNRTTTMASEAIYDSYDELPLWHAWINGEGGYHKMDADSQAPGYTLNNWGGTVGVDVDMSPQTTMGLAITAMYGNLKPESMDETTGNVDVTYLSGFVRATGGAWIHTFVMSGGWADVQLDRTVNYGTGSYRTRGSTDGYVLGAMYEVGYTRLISASGTFALQPVFNVEARHASIKGYTETGSDAGLHVDDISQDAITFGLGARMQSIVGENSFNRTAIFEARLLLKADVGDRSGTADNTLLGAVTSAEVESAEVGAIGVEVGAGLTIPLGSSSGSIFMDASVERRRGWTSLDASAGYRISF